MEESQILMWRSGGRTWEEVEESLKERGIHDREYINLLKGVYDR